MKQLNMRFGTSLKRALRIISYDKCNAFVDHQYEYYVIILPKKIFFL